VNTIASWSAGLPFTVKPSTVLAQTTNPNGSNVGGSYVNVLGSWYLDNPQPEQWFNINAFGQPRLGTLGNERRNQLYGPPQRRWDFSIFKTFRVTERINLQFRTEMFNITNTPNFFLPTSKMVTAGSSAGGFGKITSTTPGSTPRQVQFALKLQF
jgi:hypothetical protein